MHKKVAGKERLSSPSACAQGVVLLKNSCHRQAFISPCEECHGHLPCFASEDVHTWAQTLQKSYCLQHHDGPCVLGAQFPHGDHAQEERKVLRDQDRDREILQYYTIYS